MHRSVKFPQFIYFYTVCIWDRRSPAITVYTYWKNLCIFSFSIICSAAYSLTYSLGAAACWYHNTVLDILPSYLSNNDTPNILFSVYRHHCLSAIWSIFMHLHVQAFHLSCWLLFVFLGRWGFGSAWWHWFGPARGQFLFDIIHYLFWIRKSIIRKGAEGVPVFSLGLTASWKRFNLRLMRP